MGQSWQQRVLQWANELKSKSPSLASLLLCADFLNEDERTVTLVVGNEFHRQMLSTAQAMSQLLAAALAVGLPEKRVLVMAAAQCEKALPTKETVVKDVWENLI